jgi:hypothetical protein
VKTTSEGLKVAVKEVKKRVITVVYKEEERFIRVITVY